MQRSRGPLAIVTALVAATAPVMTAVALTGQAFPSALAASERSVAPMHAYVSNVPAPVRVVPVAKPRPTQRAVRPTTAAKPVALRTVTVARHTTAPVHTTSTAPVRRATAAPTTTTAAPKPAATTITPKITSTATGNDYPYASAVGNPSDPWGFTERQCVSFAAWRLAQHGHALDNATQNWGSALTWDNTAAARGVPVSRTPRVGAIAQWNAGESSAAYLSGSSTPNATFTAGGYGHVGYVAAVYSDGSVLIEQYNMGDSRSYSVMRMKAPRYLLF